jgi:hypothetical protein
MTEPDGSVVEPFDYSNGRLEPSRAFPEGRAVHRPMLRVTLRTIYDGWLSCYAVVDSGADYCAFPQSFMKPLGIEPQEFETVETANGDAPVYFGVVLIDLVSVKNYEPYNVRVGFHPGHICMLGQDGFFDRFNVGFNRAEKCFAITNRKFADEPDAGTNRR